MHNLKTLLEQTNELPSLPEIYIRVSELLEDDLSDAYQIGEAVQIDPFLTAKILKLINSAYYGLPHPVTSVSQAVSLLGREHLKQILLGSVLAEVFSDMDIDDFPMRDFWHHSIKTAIIARHLAMQNARIIDHEAFFTAGLLHDIGRLVIAKVAPESVAEIDSIVKSEGADIVEVEAQLIGVTHIDVGAALMKKWSLPSLLSQCVLKHHSTEHLGPFAMDTCIVFLANQLSQHELADDEEQMDAILSAIPNWQESYCTLPQIYAACQLADEQWYEVMDSLGMAGMKNSDELFLLSGA